MEGRQEGQERAKCARRGPLTSPRHDLSRVGRQRGERLDQSSPPRGAVVRAAQVSRGEIAGAALRRRRKRCKLPAAEEKRRNQLPIRENSLVSSALCRRSLTEGCSCSLLRARSRKAT